MAASSALSSPPSSFPLPQVSPVAYPKCGLLNAFPFSTSSSQERDSEPTLLLGISSLVPSQSFTSPPLQRS